MSDFAQSNARYCATLRRNQRKRHGHAVQGEVIV
jgi:hypothetical protein